MAEVPWELIKTLLADALERNPRERRAFVAEACGNDAALEARVLELLLHEQDARRVFEAPTAPSVSDDVHDPPITGGKIGRYEVRGVIGAGGMGTVYEAVQDHPHRLVALKVLRRGVASRSALRRFQHEAEILGRLRHPNIAQIFDASMLDQREGARPYFAMELIKGQLLPEYAEAKGLGTRQRLELFVKVCAAVQHAHLKGVIHRDLKPANILVDEYGEPKILDFGVARTTDSDMQLTTIHTRVGELIGTVPYMSPEQVTGVPGELDARSDIYALGVVMHELLTGRLPYDLQDKSIPEAVRIITEADPTRLSTVDRSFRGDLDTIAGRALEKEKDQRYQSVAELAADVRRYLADEPIVARPASASYQLRKFARRHKAIVAGASAVVIALAGGAITTTWQAVSAIHQRNEAQGREAEAAAISDFLMEMLSLANPSEVQLTGTPVTFTRATNLLDLMDKASGEIDTTLAPWPEKRAELHERFAQNYRGFGRLLEWQREMRSAYELRRAALGEDHEITLETLSRLADCETDAGRIEDAKRMHREAVEGLTQVLGAAHRKTLIATRQRAMLIGVYERKYDEAETLLRTALDMMQETLEDRDPEIVRTASKLAAVLQRAGKHEQAEQTTRRWYQVAVDTLGDDHYQTWQLSGHLGIIRLGRGDAAEAERLLRRSRDAMIEQTGRVSRETLRHSFFLAMSLSALGSDVESDDVLRQIVEDTRVELGEDHFHTWLNHYQIGLHRTKQGRFLEAEFHLRQAVDGYARVLGEDNWRTLAAVDSLGRVLCELREYEEAEFQLTRSLEGQNRVRGKHHLGTLTTRSRLAQLLSNQGKFAKAEYHYLELLEGVRQVRGDEHPQTLQAVNGLADLYDAWGNPKKAAQYREMLRDAEEPNVSG